MIKKETSETKREILDNKIKIKRDKHGRSYAKTEKEIRIDKNRRENGINKGKKLRDKDKEIENKKRKIKKEVKENGRRRRKKELKRWNRVRETENKIKKWIMNMMNQILNI